VKLSVNLHGSLSTNFDPSLQEATAFGGAGMDDAVALANQIAQEMCSDPTNFCGPNISDDSGLNVSFALADVTNCAAGCYVGLTGWLEVFTRAVHIGGNTAASHSADAMANFLNTAGFHIDVLTPGWTATSLSGTDYSTASSESAPEPADAVLSAFGLGLLALVSRRKSFSKA
jgi:MYXO-CTERM domain-containing protein